MFFVCVGSAAPVLKANAQPAALVLQARMPTCVPSCAPCAHIADSDVRVLVLYVLHHVLAVGLCHSTGYCCVLGITLVPPVLYVAAAGIR